MSIHQRFAPSNQAHEISLLDEFTECCGYQRWFLDEGWISKQVAVDACQLLGECMGLPSAIGVDAFQAILVRAFAEDIEPAEEVPTPAARRDYRTPQSTIDAFMWIVRNDTPTYLAEWLASHPQDKAHLHAIWERKCSAAM